MLAYVTIVFFIIAGQILVDSKVLKKELYCWIVCIVFTLLCGLRSENLGMWDTSSVYIPSFNIINSHSILDLLEMHDTQYKFIGFVLYSKFIGQISENHNFFIFMMGWPFYVALTYIIIKYTRRPVYSFLSILAMGYLTYSFSMMRGMLAFSAICMALDAALDNKWKKMVIWTTIGASFHITALLFLVSYFVKKITWSFTRIITIFVVLFAFRDKIPSIWESFVSNYVSLILPTYNYYGFNGGVIATGMIIVYAVILLTALVKTFIGPQLSKIHCKKNNKNNLMSDENINFLFGLSVLATVLMTLTYVLSEMIRIAMILGFAIVLLAGMGGLSVSTKNMRVVSVIEWIEALVLIIYFLFAALPNMNSVPYLFFWE